MPPSRDVYLLDRTKGEGDSAISPLVADDRYEETAIGLSPDGRWLAYTSNESGRQEVYVRPFPDVNAGRWQISGDGGTEPRWAHSGRELFYRRADRMLMSVAVTLTPTFEPGAERPLFSASNFLGNFAYPNYDVTRDDRQFMFIRPVATPGDEGPTTAILVQQEIRRLDVAVDDPHAKSGSQAAGDLSHLADGLAGRQLSVAAQDILERVSLDELHHDHQRSVVRGIDSEHLSDRGVREAGDGAGLPQEPLLVPGVLDVLLVQDLDGDATVEETVAAAVHLSHTAFPDLDLDLVRSELGQRRGHLLGLALGRGRPGAGWDSLGRPRLIHKIFMNKGIAVLSEVLGAWNSNTIESVTRKGQAS